MFKEIAGNTGNPDRLRANAVQEIGSMFYTYADPKITDEIFKDQSYASLQTKGNVALTYRHLFEYASSLYPLARSELYIAGWYASELLKQSNSNAKTSTKIPSEVDAEAYVAIIAQKLKNADHDIEQMRQSSFDDASVPITLSSRASTIGKLDLAGIEAFGTGKDAYQKVLDEYKSRGWTNGFLHFRYASFLAQKNGESSAGDIRAILAPLYSGDVAYALTGDFLRKERGNVTGSKEKIILLAGYDSKFKSYLLTLGWKAADFAKK